MSGPATARSWERWAWLGGVVYVAALLIEAIVSTAISANQNDSAAKIASEVHRHRDAVLVAAYFSAVYAVAFVIYLAKLHQLLREQAGPPPFLGTLVLVGGVLFVALHTTSDVGIYGLLGGKLAAYDNESVTYTLYLLTFALDSVGDVFGSLFALAGGLIVLETRVLPRWVGQGLIAVAVLFFLQGFGLGGVIADFGLVLDLIGFVLFLVLVAASSIMLFRRGA
jgi:hypothetical protein